jgi:hypothetical protein
VVLTSKVKLELFVFQNTENIKQARASEGASYNPRFLARRKLLEVSGFGPDRRLDKTRKRSIFR